MIRNHSELVLFYVTYRCMLHDMQQSDSIDTEIVLLINVPTFVKPGKNINFLIFHCIFERCNKRQGKTFPTKIRLNARSFG